MKYKKLDLVQGSPEWLSARLEYVTSSNVPCLFGLSPYKTALEYATELLTKKEKDSPEDKEYIFERGHLVERAAREWTRSNLNIEFSPTVIISTEISCLMASLDGMEEKKGILFEAKLIGKDALNDVKNGILKPHHEYQVQSQLRASGFDKLIYFGMDPSGDAAIMDVIPNPEIQKQISETVPSFWANLQAGILPEATDKDILVVDDPELDELFQLEMKMKEIENQYSEKEKSILNRYKDRARVAGRGVHISRVWRKGNVDYSKVPQLRGVDLDRYRKSGSLVTQVRFDKKKGA